MAHTGALKMKVIQPKKLNDVAAREVFRHALERVGAGMLRDLEKTTATWEHKPKFRISTSAAKSGGGALMVEAYTDSEIYGFVVKGTKPHEIWAGIYTGKSNKKVLAFASAFSPKTTPGVIGSVAGHRGATDTFRPMVHHPGTAPRKFDEIIQQLWDRKFKVEMEKSMRDVAKASGHAM